MTPTLDLLLHAIAQATPKAWYPGPFAQAAGVPRDDLEPLLDQLRLAGLIEFTPWESGHGQGYALTPAGSQVVRTPRLMSRLRSGAVPEVQSADPEDRDVPSIRGEAVRQALFSEDPGYVRKALTLANVIVFVAGLIIAVRNGGSASSFLSGAMAGGAVPAANIDALHATGALSSGLDLKNGEWWRLLTCCFVHDGLLHLGMNMYALYALGRLAGSLWGQWRLLLIYLLSGIGGSCLAMSMHADHGLVGASGCICGVLASLIAWFLLNRSHLGGQLVSQMMGQFGQSVIWLVIISVMPRVSWAGHLGGAIAGFLASIFLNTNRFGPPLLRLPALLLVVVVPALSVGWLLRGMNTNKTWVALEKVARNRDVRKEYEIFNEQLLPAANVAFESALSASEVAEDLIQTKPPNRSAQDVRKARLGLSDARKTLGEAIDQFEAAGEFADEKVSATVAAGQRYMRALDRELDLLDQALAAGREWTAERDRELEDQRRQTQKARNYWNDKFR